MAVVEIPVRGAFALAEGMRLGFGHRVSADDDDAMRMAFVLDGYREPAAVAVTQPAPDLVRVDVVAGDPDAAARQTARILSLDVDGTRWDALAASDPLLSRVVAARPGLRPPLFHSAYECLLWAVLSARRPAARMAVVRDRFAAEHGAVFDVAGQTVAAMPVPERMAEITAFEGLPDVILERMRAIGAEAAAGLLDTEALRARDPDEVAAELRRLPGIGPFSSEMVTVRALGHTDALPSDEPRVRAAAAGLLGRDALSQAEFTEMAEAWRPWRTWAVVAIRAGAPLVDR
ncbi:MAG: DNA-3-methyladenine glycosylase 2 family protein [Thermoleophilia bacterium]|nr:DNA-3-methyladenine glycosylase 2 family protein [Thermoleophilia bacterium]